MRSVFSRVHPAVSFTYFALVIVLVMCLRHPLCLAASLTGGAAWAAYLRRGEAARLALAGLLPLLLFTWALNPLFSHAGVTILAYFPSGNPLTLESILYGLSAAAMLGAVLCWFYCYHATMSSDKFICLFGRAIPALSLFLSMVLRFVPRFRSRLRTVAAAQRCGGRGTGGGSLLRRGRNAVRVLSIMVTWSLESAVETADSMRSRGYGLPGRTAFSIYRFHTRDKLCAAWLLALGGFLLWAGAKGALAWQYFPRTEGAAGPLTLWAWAGYLALCLTPVILDRKEDAQWRRLRSAV